ncbi:hypothetical protein KR018_003950 [Drosophila ironensis]|nr:hypothetical protein KR018_003950 [Drosophila ironensis]
MPPKKSAKVKAEPEKPPGPPPPNVFLYIQLAGITSLPPTRFPLMLRLSQGESPIVKCTEQYTTDGIIYQHEFSTRPTFTLIFQQDDVDRINQAADNPLLIELLLQRVYHGDHEYLDEEEEEGEFTDDNLQDQIEINTITSFDRESSVVHKPRLTTTIELLCVGYLDVIKLFGHQRTMIREKLYLYPMPDVSEELRHTVHTEWDLYTLLPIAKQLTFTNMAFVTLESIYNLKEEYCLDPPSLQVVLSFRSTLPNERNEYQIVPLCSFDSLELQSITLQSPHHVFESFRRNIRPSNVTGLKSSMEVEMYRIFDGVMCTDGMPANFSDIDQGSDDALVCNSFHRFILTKKMAETLSYAIACQQYVLFVEAFQMLNFGKPQKVFQGILDPSIMAYPGVRIMRFAVQLDYLGKLKTPVKRMTKVSLGQASVTLPTFAIIKLCLLAPIGEIYRELQVFRNSFISQNRLLFCHQPVVTPKVTRLVDIQRDAYARFDRFIRDCISFIVEKRIKKIEERRQHFCCVVQNLANILMKVVGSVYNTRTPTDTNVDFANLCALAYNDLERRVHGIVLQVENEGFDLAVGRADSSDRLVDYLNNIKMLRLVGDNRVADVLLDRAANEFPSDERFAFFKLIVNMEFCEYEQAKAYFTNENLASHYEYFTSWIKLYINYMDTRDNPETQSDCTECLLRSITNFAEQNTRQQDAWILLYCYYKKFKYGPGTAYARWHFEDQNGVHRMSSSTAPHSLWGNFIAVNPNVTDKRAQSFLDVFKMFVRLGLFEFAQVVFNTVEHKCDESDRYLVKTQLAILLNQLDEDFELITYDFGEGPEAMRAAAFNAQINGNVEYHRGRKNEAADFYQLTMKLPPVEENERDFFELSKMRLAYISYEMGDDYKSIEALGNVCSSKLTTALCEYLKGKSYYRIGNYSVAISCFAKCTLAGTHLPNAWGFLALINLKLGDNYKAIECWKYSRIEPDRSIDDEMIYEELDALDVDAIDLYIDAPSFADENYLESESL